MRPEGPAAIPRRPLEYARLVWFDSLTLSSANLRFIVQELGGARVLMGSDYPVGFLAGAGLDDATRAAIEGGNAARFLG